MTSRIADDLSAAIREATDEMRKLTSEAVSERPSPDQWTIKEVLGHLIDSAANNHQRFVRAQFVDGLAFPKYEQNEWVSCQRYDDLDWLELIDFWARYNQHLVHIIRHVRHDSLAVRCTIDDNEPVTLQFLVEDYVVHLRRHLRQISERVGEHPKRFTS